MNKDRIVKHIGIVNIDGKLSIATSTKAKYAVWCDLPETGVKHVSFEWHTMPDGTTLESAVAILQHEYRDLQSVLAVAAVNMLNDIAAKWQPKKAKVRKVTRKRNAKVSIVTPDKQLSDVEARNARDLAAAKILARINTQ